ncbi:MAG: Fur family transcriptional regulator [Bifidobacterium sp.]|nr:Fur family transcriptional regulator [Bifidobacterium sp.]
MVAMARNTHQKDVIREALQEHTSFISAQQLHRRLEAMGESISLATVYRQLGALADSGQVDTVRMRGEQLYRYCGEDGHHHHLICTNCGRTVAIDPPSEDWLRSIAAEHGFTMQTHTLEVFGLCPDCRASQAEDAFEEGKED